MKGQRRGITLLVINTNNTSTTIHIPAKAEQYTLASKELKGTTIQLNGQELQLTANDEIPEIKGKAIAAGDISLPPTSISFITFADAGNADVK